MTNNLTQLKDTEIVAWDDKYATGIELIDEQHKQLVALTNELYSACRAGEDVLQTVFKESMSYMVKYVHFHFDSELKLLNAIKFPDYLVHKKMHDSLVYDILAATKDYNEGKKTVPYQFVRTLKDWIFNHIAISDKLFGNYTMELIRKGIMTPVKLKEIEMSIELSLI
jgi:hemerythrin